MKRILSIFSKLPPYANTAIVALVIAYLTLVPHPLPEDTPPLFPNADKLVHAIMFWALFTAMLYDWRRRAAAPGAKAYPRGVLVLLLAVTIAAGGGVEIAQWAMGLGRGADLYDFIADTTGALVGYVLSPRLVTWLLS